MIFQQYLDVLSFVFLLCCQFCQMHLAGQLCVFPEMATVYSATKTPNFGDPFCPLTELVAFNYHSVLWCLLERHPLLSDVFQWTLSSFRFLLHASGSTIHTFSKKLSIFRKTLTALCYYFPPIFITWKESHQGNW